NQAVMAHADWIVDLGPGAGHDGGRIVFEGTPADLVAARSTLTGEHLADYAGAPRPAAPARPARAPKPTKTRGQAHAPAGGARRAAQHAAPRPAPPDSPR